MTDEMQGTAIEQIARVCHEANRGYQVSFPAHGIPVAPMWDEWDEESRAGVCHGVRGVLAGDTPAASHEKWLAFKAEHGWTYGPVKDEEAKTHPCMVPYDELPLEQQRKDALFGAIINALAPPARYFDEGAAPRRELTGPQTLQPKPGVWRMASSTLARWLTLSGPERRGIADTLRNACPIHERERIDAALERMGKTGWGPVNQECKCDGQATG